MSTFRCVRETPCCKSHQPVSGGRMSYVFCVREVVTAQFTFRTERIHTVYSHSRNNDPRTNGQMRLKKKDAPVTGRSPGSPGARRGSGR